MTTPGAPMEARAREVLWNAVFGWTGSDDAMTDRTVSAILNGLETEGIEFATAPTPAAEEVEEDGLTVAYMLGSKDERDRWKRAVEEMRERCASLAERDVNWTTFAQRGLEQWEDGPDPARDYRLGVAVGAVIAAHIRALPLTGAGAGGEEE